MVGFDPKLLCLPGRKSGACLHHHCDVSFPGGTCALLQSLVLCLERLPVSVVSGVVDRLKTKLFLEKGDVCAGTDVVEAVVVGAVGDVGAVDVVAAPLLTLFSCTLLLLKL